jgi:hypothetical protein
MYIGYNAPLIKWFVIYPSRIILSGFVKSRKLPCRKDDADKGIAYSSF